MCIRDRDIAFTAVNRGRCCIIAGGRIVVIPVSYTHLDVYKRQSRIGATIALGFVLFFVAVPSGLSGVVWAATGAAGIPVSYTHLDVYKRQVYNQRARRKRGGQTAGETK